ncbi:MAG TPA: ribosomal protein S18-alanine N-acetyltransferase [Anaerolineales bacterium]|nr:ribosomal protein S18-alanine N-acetyltransferase [Anaerolineales bacterium]
MIVIRPMALADIPAVMEIDRQSFTLPWSENSFRKEVTQNEQAHFFVAVEGDQRVIGFAGYWYIVDECHISTIAVHPGWRRRGIGEMLLVVALKHAVSLGAVMATLEVRDSNKAAIHLYYKYGFVGVGLRRRYYRDNGDDAVLMTAEPIRMMSELVMSDITSSITCQLSRVR